MSCGSTHYPGCACHEARWEDRLAAAEARVKALEDALRGMLNLYGKGTAPGREGRALAAVGIARAALAPPPQPAAAEEPA